MTDCFLAQRLLIVTIDGLNASFLGPYGNTWFSTPFFNRFASQSLLLEALYTHTLQPESFVSQTMASCLQRAARWKDRAHFASDIPLMSTSLGAEFASTKEFEGIKSSQRMASSLERTLAVGLASRALDWIDALPSGELFWLHASGLNHLWDAPADLRLQLCDDDGPEVTRWLNASQAQEARASCENLEDWQFQVQTTYAAQVQVWDFALSHLIAAVQEKWKDIPHSIVITSPRGFSMATHGQCGDDASLWDEVWQVPLLMQWDSLSAAVRSSRLSSTSELGSALADLGLGTESWTPDSWLWFRDRLDIPSLPQISLESASTRALKTSEWTLRVPQDGKPQLFVRPDDRFQINDVADRLPEVVSELQSQWVTSSVSDSSAPVP